MLNEVNQFHPLRHRIVPTFNTVDAVIVECPTKHEVSDDQKTKVKPHPAITSKQWTQVSSSPEKIYCTPQVRNTRD